MTYIVTVTSQGQISIPAPVRKKMGFPNTRKLVIEMKDDNTAEIRPVIDIMDLAGIFKSKKKYTRKQERDAFEEYFANRKKWKNI